MRLLIRAILKELSRAAVYDGGISVSACHFVAEGQTRFIGQIVTQQVALSCRNTAITTADHGRTTQPRQAGKEAGQATPCDKPTTMFSTVRSLPPNFRLPTRPFACSPTSPSACSPTRWLAAIRTPRLILPQAPSQPRYRRPPESTGAAWESMARRQQLSF